MPAPLPAMPFGEVLEAANRLTADEQEQLTAIINRRLAELRRQQLVSEVCEARREFAAGQCRTTLVDDLMDEIQS